MMTDKLQKPLKYSKECDSNIKKLLHLHKNNLRENDILCPNAKATHFLK